MGIHAHPLRPRPTPQSRPQKIAPGTSLPIPLPKTSAPFAKPPPSYLTAFPSLNPARQPCSESNLCVRPISAVHPFRTPLRIHSRCRNKNRPNLSPSFSLNLCPPVCHLSAPPPGHSSLIRCAHLSGSLRSSVSLRSARHFRPSTRIHFRVSIPLASSLTRTSHVPGSSFGARSSLSSTIPFSAA